MRRVPLAITHSPSPSCLLLVVAWALPISGAARAQELKVTVVESTNPDGMAESQAAFNENGVAYVVPKPPFQLSFATDFKVTLDRDRHREHRPLEARVGWMTTGAQDSERRFRVTLTALDANGKVLFRTWQTEGDNRIGPVEIQLGSRKGVRSIANSMNLRVPYWAADETRAIRIELAARAKSIPHDPDSPSPLNLRMTRPDDQGHFDLLFDNPEQGTPDVWKLEADKHQAVVTLRAGDPNQPRQRLLLDARPEGGYRVALQVPPADLEKASISLIFWTRQADHDAFVRRFFESGNGGGYRGLWHQSSSALRELPFATEPPAR